MSTAEPTPSSFETFRSHQRTYRRVFAEQHGPFPHPCHFCGEEVDGHTAPLDAGAAVVHHVDHDWTNNAAENLVPAHHGCHVSYHNNVPDRRAQQSALMTALNQSPEVRAKISAAMTGRKLSPEAVAKMRASLTGRQLSPEHVAKLRGRKLSPEARAKLSAAQKGKPKSPEHRANMRGPKSPELLAKLDAASKARAAARASCLNCHRELSVAGLPTHLRACRRESTAAAAMVFEVSDSSR